MILPPAWNELRYHERQYAAYTCPDRLVAIRAGRRAGKNELAFRRLVQYLPVKTWHKKPGRYAYIAPVRDQAKRISWERLKALVPPEWVASISESELVIRTHWGAELHVLGFDKPFRIEGVGWDGVVVDESSDIKPGAFDKSVRPALADRLGWAWRMGIPKRKGVGAREFKQICEDRKLGYTLFEWSSIGILADSEIQAMSETMDKKDFDEQIRAMSVEEGGQAFYSFSPEYNISLAAKYDPNKRIAIGSDFNVNPMAWVLAHVHNNKLYVFDEIWLTDTNTRRTLNELHKRYPNHKAGFTFYGDASGRARKTAGSSTAQSDYLIIKQDERFEEEDKDGVSIRYPKSNPPIKDRLASCNALLCNAADKRNCFISPSCTHLKDDLTDRSLDDTGKPADADKDMGHISDAFGYLVHGLFPIQSGDPVDYDDDGETPDEHLPRISFSVIG